jgi:hypothetical protein
MKFLRSVRPEEPIGFSARKLGDIGGLVQCAVEARVGQHLVAEGQIILTEVSSRNERPQNRDSSIGQTGFQSEGTRRMNEIT